MTTRYCRLAFTLCMSMFSIHALPAQMLKVPQPIWDALNAEQKSSLTEKYTVNLIAANSYGTIIDIQVVNESTPGSNAGSRLGAAYGSAAYVDRSFSGPPRNWNYSATNNITASLIGAAIGSLADQQAVARFHTRYTVKTGAGGVEYIDEIKSDAFRHSSGLCMSLHPLQSINTDICTQTVEQFISKHLPRPAQQVIEPPPQQTQLLQPLTHAAPPVQATRVSPSESQNAEDSVLCKFGLSSPIRIKRDKCVGASGEILN